MLDILNNPHDITLFADTLQGQAKPDSIKQGIYGVTQGHWAGTELYSDTLKHYVDTLGNTASLEGATDDELALIGHAVKITIEAFKQENENQEAINALQTAAINADGYIKARREGYTVGTDNYLTVAPFITQTNIPAIDTIATKPDSVNVYAGLTAEAIQNIHNLYNAQLDQLQQKVNDMQSELSSYKKDDYTGKPVEQAVNADTTLYGKLLAIKAAADQVATDASENLKGFIGLYEYLNDSINKGTNSIKGIHGQFKNSVDTAQSVATKDQWVEVYKSFQTGKDSLVIDDGETVKPDSIKLLDAMAAQYGEYYPKQQDRTVDSITDGIDEWQEELQRLFGEGRTGQYGLADSNWVNRVTGEYNKIELDMQVLWKRINEANAIFNNTYDAQILADNATAWASYQAADQLARITYVNIKDSLEAYKKAAAKNEGTNAIVTPLANTLNIKLYELSTLITKFYDEAKAHYQDADIADTLYLNEEDLKHINGVTDSLAKARNNFLSDLFNGLRAFDTSDYTIDPWRDTLITATPFGQTPISKRYIIADSTFADPAVVFAAEYAQLVKVNYLRDSLLATEYDKMTPEMVDDMATTLTEMGDSAAFAATLDSKLVGAAVVDVNKRVDDFTDKVAADKTEFEKKYNDGANYDDFSHQVSTEDYTRLTNLRDSIVKATLDSAKLAGGTIVELPIDRDSVLTYIDRYNTLYADLETQADQAAADYKHKWTNNKEFAEKQDSLLEKLRNVIDYVEPTYIEEDYNPTFIADTVQLTAPSDFLNSLDPTTDEGKAKLDSLGNVIDNTIVDAFNAEKGKLSEEYAALYNDYTILASRKNDAYIRASNDAAANQDPSKQAELDAITDSLKDIYDEFVENYDNGHTSYFEKQAAAKEITMRTIDAPVDSAELEEFRKLCEGEAYIAALRNDLAAQVAGQSIDEFNQPMNDSLAKEYSHVLSVLENAAIGAEDDYLGYDWKQLSAKQKEIADKLDYAKKLIDQHKDNKDVMMYFERLLQRLAGIENEIGELEAMVTPAKTRKATSVQIHENLADYVEKLETNLGTFYTYAETVKNEVEGFATFQKNSVEWGVKDTVLIDVNSLQYFGVQPAAEDAPTSYPAVITYRKNKLLASIANQLEKFDSLTNEKILDEVLLAMPTAQQYLDGPAYDEHMDDLDTMLTAQQAMIDAIREKAANTVARRWYRLGEEAFPNQNGNFLTPNQAAGALVDYLQNANNVKMQYPAATITRMLALIGQPNDPTAETSIFGAINELRDTIGHSKANGNSYRDLAEHKERILDIVERILAISDSLDQKLLGDLDGVNNPGKYGDGGNGTVNVNDMQILINIVLGKTPMPAANSDLFGAADIDANGVIDINDVTCIANLIMTGARYYNWDSEEIIRYARQASDRSERLSAVLVSTEDGQRTYAVNLHSDKAYSAFQIDLQLPEGMELISEGLTGRANGHKLYTNDMERTHRVVVHQYSNKGLKGSDGAVYTFTVQGEGELGFDNIVFSQADGHSTAFAIDGTTTGIQDKLQNMATDAKETIYNVGGRVMDTLRKGVNIIRRDNGETEKKVVK